MPRRPRTDDTAHAPREIRDTKTSLRSSRCRGAPTPPYRSSGGTGGVAAPVPPGEPLPWDSPGGRRVAARLADTGLAGLDARVDRLARRGVRERHVHAAVGAAAAVDRGGPAGVD